MTTHSEEVLPELVATILRYEVYADVFGRELLVAAFVTRPDAVEWIASRRTAGGAWSKGARLVEKAVV